MDGKSEGMLLGIPVDVGCMDATVGDNVASDVSTIITGASVIGAFFADGAAEGEGDGNGESVGETVSDMLLLQLGEPDGDGEGLGDSVGEIFVGAVDGAGDTVT